MTGGRRNISRAWQAQDPSRSRRTNAARAALKVWENLMCVAIYKWFDFYLLLNNFIGSTFLLRTSTEATPLTQAQTEELSVDESRLHYMSQRRFTSSTARREMPTTR